MTLKSAIIEVCESSPGTPTTWDVRNTLRKQGVTVSREHASRVVNEWRKERGLGDTGEMLALTDARIAEIDGIESGVTPEVTRDVTPADAVTPVHKQRSHQYRWLLALLALPAAVSVWSGWVGLGGMCGFGVVQLLPGIADNVVINTAITLPIGVESYAVFALWVWLTNGHTGTRARRFARVSAILSLVVGGAGQVAYHLLVQAGYGPGTAPWPVTAVVSLLTVAIVGMASALIHLLGETDAGKGSGV